MEKDLIKKLLQIADEFFDKNADVTTIEGVVDIPPVRGATVATFKGKTMSKKRFMTAISGKKENNSFDDEKWAKEKNMSPGLIVLEKSGRDKLRKVRVAGNTEGYFHKFITKDGNTYALVEDNDGNVDEYCIEHWTFQFLD